MNDLVIVPLRVSREQRRLWRVEAGRADKSVQTWLLEQLAGQVKLVGPVVEQAKPEPAKARVEVTKGRVFMGAYTK